MKRAIALACTAGIAGVAVMSRGQTLPARFAFTDRFDQGLCTGDCPTARWAIRQQENGTVSAAPAPGRGGLALTAEAGPKTGRVAKADIVARTAPMGAGTVVTVAFDLYAPRATPLNSIQLVDLECATCGEGGNPGIRLYLRRGRLRIDRSKIGIKDAWVRDDAPVLASERWQRIVWTTRIGGEDGGRTRVTLNGREVLSGRGATAMPRGHVDRVQIGVTANSNPVPVTLYFDDVGVSAR